MPVDSRMGILLNINGTGVICLGVWIVPCVSLCVARSRRVFAGDNRRGLAGLHRRSCSVSRPPELHTTGICRSRLGVISRRTVRRLRSSSPVNRSSVYRSADGTEVTAPAVRLMVRFRWTVLLPFVAVVVAVADGRSPAGAVLRMRVLFRNG